MDAGNLDSIYVRDDERVGGPDIPLSELHARQQHQEMPEHPEEASPAPYEGLEERTVSSGQVKEAIRDPTSRATAAGVLAAQDDVVSLGHDRVRPEAQASGAGPSVSSSNIGKMGQEESPVSQAGTAAAAVIDGMPASPDGTEAKAEQPSGRADRDWEAEKLAKQQELFGRSFSKPKRYALSLCLDSTSAHTNLL